jgi:5-(carboxyamino)imidazole ribonucleotide mutase
VASQPLLVSADLYATAPQGQQLWAAAWKQDENASSGSLPMAKDPRVGVVMGSDSDLPCMQAAVEVLEEFGVAHEVRVLSAHRTPKAMVNYAESAKARGLQVLIAGAGGAAHLPGMVAALTTLPVIGVPVTSKALNGLDSLYSIVQMPAGIPVATVAIGNACNAALLALQILALQDQSLGEALHAYRLGLQAMVEAKDQRLKQLGCTEYLAERN